MWSSVRLSDGAPFIFKQSIYVELKKPIESAVDCRTLGALGMPLSRLR